jgi:translation elongation factor EF-1beta
MIFIRIKKKIKQDVHEQLESYNDRQKNIIYGLKALHENIARINISIDNLEKEISDIKSKQRIIHTKEHIH